MRVFSLTRLTSRERHVIGLLRGTDPVVATGTLPDLLNRLRGAANEAGYCPGPSGSVYATRHELCLLGALAGLQRDHADLSIRLDKKLHPIALACAQRLSADGLLLHHIALIRLTGMTDTCRELSILLVPAIRSSLRQPMRLPTPGTLQAKALRIVKGCGNATTRDLNAYGISRQVVSLMHKRGALERVRVGVYRVAHETMRG